MEINSEGDGNASNYVFFNYHVFCEPKKCGKAPRQKKIIWYVLKWYLPSCVKFNHIDETLFINEIEHKYAFIHSWMKCDIMNVSNLVFKYKRIILCIDENFQTIIYG